MTVLYLLAHQDDEIGVLGDMASALHSGQAVRIAYLTNGAWAGVEPGRRTAESLAVLASMGIGPDAVSTLGTDLSIADGRLVEHLERCTEALVAHVSGLPRLQRIVMHAWEGGHHDHDACHLVGLALAVRCGRLAATRQFPLYRAPANRFWLSFARPLEANGAVERTRIPRMERLRYLALLRHYRSQFRVMARLGPQLAWDYATDGCQKLQPVSLERAHERPNAGTMLYERWGLYTWQRFEELARPFVAHHLSAGPATPSQWGAG